MSLKIDSVSLYLQIKLLHHLRAATHKDGFSFGQMWKWLTIQQPAITIITTTARAAYWTPIGRPCSSCRTAASPFRSTPSWCRFDTLNPFHNVGKCRPHCFNSFIGITSFVAKHCQCSQTSILYHNRGSSSLTSVFWCPIGTPKFPSQTNRNDQLPIEWFFSASESRFLILVNNLVDPRRKCYLYIITLRKTLYIGIHFYAKIKTCYLFIYSKNDTYWFSKNLRPSDQFLDI